MKGIKEILAAWLGEYRGELIVVMAGLGVLLMAIGVVIR